MGEIYISGVQINTCDMLNELLIKSMTVIFKILLVKLVVNIVRARCTVACIKSNKS